MSDNVKHRIVTLKSLELPRTEGLSAQSSDMPGDELKLARYRQAQERLRQATEDVGADLMVTVQDRDTSLLQSRMAREADVDRTLSDGSREVQFGTGLTGGDWFGWIRSLFDHVDRNRAHPLVRPAGVEAEPMAEDARIALTADWGTGLYGAPKIADQMRSKAPFEVLLHLGDVYYSGTEDEIRERFLDAWPKEAGRLSRALNSNHEMYSGGFGYFTRALPALAQPSSYFALQNRHWLLVGLDTAYVDHDMDAQQVAWLNLLIQRVAQGNQGVPKKLVLFSHQQLFSRLDNQGPKLQQALRHLLETRAITAWYWGHEHQCVIYDGHAQYGLSGRCLGNGGIPEPRKREVKDAATAHTIGNVMWKRLEATENSPGCLALDGPNPDIKNEEQKFVPHGFMTLEFSGPSLTERVFLADGTEILSNRIE